MREMGSRMETAAGAGLEARARSGVEPFEEFYRRSFTGMTRLARVLVDDMEDATEVVQEAFARMLPRYDRISADRVDAYLRATVLNGCRRFIRREVLSRRHRPRSVQHAHLGADHVLDAIRRLPAPQRDVVLLRFYLDLSEAEIAQTLEIRPGTVKSRLHRALLTLREVLG